MDKTSLGFQEGKLLKYIYQVRLKQYLFTEL